MSAKTNTVKVSITFEMTGYGLTLESVYTKLLQSEVEEKIRSVARAANTSYSTPVIEIVQESQE